MLTAERQVTVIADNYADAVAQIKSMSESDIQSRRAVIMQLVPSLLYSQKEGGDSIDHMFKSLVISRPEVVIRNLTAIDNAGAIVETAGVASKDGRDVVGQQQDNEDNVIALTNNSKMLVSAIVVASQPPVGVDALNNSWRMGQQ